MRRDRNKFFSLAIAGLLLACSYSARAASAIDVDELSSYLDEAVPALLDQFHIPGATLAVVQDGELLFARGYGYSDYAAKKDVVAETSIFRIGSISKLFTWTAAMQLVERGDLDLDADVNIYLTQFQIPDTFDEPVTLRHLLTHTAAFEDGGMGWLFADSADDLVPLADFLERHMPVRFAAPGQFSTYSNWGTGLAGLIVANVSGQPFDDYIEENIFSPLGMNRSTFREPLPANLEADRSIGYKFDGENIVAGYEQFLHNIGPGGSARSTATDMAKFMIAHLTGGGAGGTNILSPKTIAQMHRTQFTHDPVLPGMGLGFMQSHTNGHHVSSHAGSTSYFHSDLILLPDEEVGLFVNFNGEPGGVAVRVFGEAFMNRFFPPGDIDQESDYSASADELSQVEGLYKPLLRSHSTWNGAMFLSAGDTEVSVGKTGIVVKAFGPPASMKAIGPYTFKEVDGDTIRSFRVDDNGNVTHMFDSSFSAVAIEKISWLESVRFYKQLGLLVLVLALTALTAPRSVWQQNPGQQRTAAIISVAAGTMIPLAFWIFTRTFTSAGHDVLIVSVPLGIKIALTLPLLIAACTAWLAYLLYKAFSGGLWSGVIRLQYSVILVGLLAFLWTTNYWNLLGYKFG